MADFMLELLDKEAKEAGGHVEIDRERLTYVVYDETGKECYRAPQSEAVYMWITLRKKFKLSLSAKRTPVKRGGKR